MPEAVIVSAVRTPVGRAYKGRCERRGRTIWRRWRSRKRLHGSQDSMRSEIDDVILGCAMPEGEQGMNVARIAALCVRDCRWRLRR